MPMFKPMKAGFFALFLSLPLVARAHQTELVELQAPVARKRGGHAVGNRGVLSLAKETPHVPKPAHPSPKHSPKQLSKLKAEQDPTDSDSPIAQGSAAEMSGVAANAAGDLSVFLTGAVTNFASMTVFFCVFSVVRRKLPIIYAGNVLADRVPFEPSDSFFGWATASLSLRMEDVITHAGLDQAMLMEFQHFGMSLLTWLMVPLLFVMGPIHWIFGGDRSGDDHLSKLGMANVVDNHPWLYWVHCGLVWFVVVSVQRAVYRAMGKFLERRKEWLKQMPAPRSTTILVQNIPPQHCTDKKVKAYFDKVFEGSVVESVYVVKRADELVAFVEEKAGHDLKLEEALYKEKTTGQRPTLSSYLGSSEEDAINHWTGKSKEAAQNMKDARKRLEARIEQGDPSVFTANAFVTFKNRRDSELALRVTYTADDDEFVCEIPPDASDVIYSDLQKDLMRQKVSHTIGYGLIAFIFWAYLPSVIGLKYLCDIDTLAKYLPFLNGVAKDESMATLWDAMVFPLALQLAIGFVPTFFVFIFSFFFVLKANAWLQHRIQNWYFWFQVLYVLLVTAVGSSVVETMDEIVNSPTYIFKLLATTMPFATHFYLNFIPVQWATHATNCLRWVQVTKYFTFKTLFGEEHAKEMCEPEDQDYYGLGSRNARHSFILVLTLVYCELTPLISALGFVNLLACRVAYGYLVVFAETRKPDLGGAFWVTNLMNVQRCMAIYIVLMAGVLCYRFDDPWPCAIAGSSLIFWYVSFSRFPGAFRWESLCFEDCCDNDFVAKRTPATKNTYVQKELLES